MKPPWDAIVWWEIRRIPFNLLLLVVGFVSGFISLTVGDRLYGPDQDFGSPFLSAVFFAVCANFCYTLGWITEVLWSWGNTAQTVAIRPRVFRVGVIFSVGLTLLPAIVFSVMWAIHR